MRILVTGKNGQVGAELKKLGDFSPYHWLYCDRSALDISKPSEIDRVIKDWAPNVVINAAAYTNVDKAESDKDAVNVVNAEGPGHLAKACAFYGAALLHISTDYVFSGLSGRAHRELDAATPLSVYGSSKLAGETAVDKYCPRHIILRTSWVFGAHGNNFVKTILNAAQSHDTLSIVGDQFGAPTSAAGIAAALLRIAEEINKGEVNWGRYHYSGAPFTTWYGFARVIIDAAAKRDMLPQPVFVKAITTAEYPTQVQRPKNSKLDSRKIKMTFGIDPDNWQIQLGRVLDALR